MWKGGERFHLKIMRERSKQEVLLDMEYNLMKTVV